MDRVTVNHSKQRLTSWLLALFEVAVVFWRVAWKSLRRRPRLLCMVRHAVV